MSSMLLVLLILTTRQHDYDDTAGTMSRLRVFCYIILFITLTVVLFLSLFYRDWSSDDEDEGVHSQPTVVTGGAGDTVSKRYCCFK